MRPERVIPIPGPRYFGSTAFGAVSTLLWYVLVAPQLPRILGGSGVMFDTGTRAVDLLLWLCFMLLPLFVIRFFVWNALGWEYVRVVGATLVVERKAFGIPLFHREVYDVSKIVRLHSEGPPPINHESWVMRRPSEVGALVFDYEGNTIRFGYSLLERRDVADEVVETLGKWMGFAADNRHA